MLHVAPFKRKPAEGENETPEIDDAALGERLAHHESGTAVAGDAPVVPNMARRPSLAAARRPSVAADIEPPPAEEPEGFLYLLMFDTLLIRFL